MRKLILSLVAIVAIAGIALTQIKPGGKVIGTAKNVHGTILVKHAGSTSETALTEGALLLDDDELSLYPGSGYDAVSAFGMPAVTIKHGDLGYWNAELGTKNPPDPKWSRCRATFYSSYF